MTTTQVAVSEDQGTRNHVAPLRVQERLGPGPVSLTTPCPFCGRQCRVAVSRSMPRHVVAAYEQAGLESMRTCDAGAVAESHRLGVSYADVVTARIQRVLGAASVLAARTPRPERALGAGET
jgi:hypothetical protein